jgi:hypothetical protein
MTNEQLKEVKVMKTKTYHYRIVETANWKENVLGNGGVTVIAQESELGGIAIGYSICSTLDRFCKKTGRDIAHTRLKEDPVIVNLKGIPSRDTMMALMEEGLIRQSNGTPFPMYDKH